MLVLRDLKARTKQAYLGYFWILIQPLLLTGAFSFLVQQVLQRSDLSDVPYPVFVMAGVIPWQFFANSLNESTESLVKNVDLVRQVYFPREILAIYPVFARLVDVAVGCAALGVFMLVLHVPVSGWVVLLPVMLQTLLGYPPVQAGIAMAPRGIGSRCSCPSTFPSRLPNCSARSGLPVERQPSPSPARCRSRSPARRCPCSSAASLRTSSGSATRSPSSTPRSSTPTPPCW